MESAQKKWTAGIGGAAILAVARFGKTAHIWGAEVDDALRSSYSVTRLHGDLVEIKEGSYVESQAVDLFCTATASLNTTGELPDEATSWRAFVQSRVGADNDPEQYFEGKAARLETAIDVAQQNPQAAWKYTQACLTFD